MNVILQQIQERGQRIAIDDLRLPTLIPVVEAIQTRLCELGILDPIIIGDKLTPFKPVRLADGRFGPETLNAIATFHRYIRSSRQEALLHPDFFQALANSTADAFFPVQFNPLAGDSQQVIFAKRILRYMRKKEYWIARAPDMFNIVYVEGVDGNGKPNADRLNEWNDRRCVIRILPGGQPEMLVNDQATTEPGQFYTQIPSNPQGVARIAFGQYKAWKDGKHRGRQPALVQCGMVRLHRDLNKNGRRDAADPIDVGDSFGINQHSTSQIITPEFVNKYSSGCLVGRRYAYHLSFLHIIRQDFRYVGNRGYMFMSAILNGDDLAREEPV
jgi:hypothetical protein